MLASRDDVTEEEAFGFLMALAASELIGHSLAENFPLLRTAGNPQDTAEGASTNVQKQTR